MKKRMHLATRSSLLLSGVAVGAIASGSAAAQSFGDEIVVTAQRQEQSIQDVPIAVSAFSGNDLQDRQLESFQDIQFNIPNFAFSRSNFTGSTIVLRGVGALAVGASTEPAVSIHVNEVFISSPRLFETEFFDIERLEILRGPQGTLFGRNATGGVINVITAKASVDGIEGYADAEYGNYNSVKVQGALNIPLSDTLAFRLAGTTIQRDGYTENLFDGRDIDDRNIYALRASTRWLPTENTTIDFTASYMREADSRTRWQQRACEQGPLSPLLGCDPNGPRRFDQQDLRATFFANTSSQTLALATGNPAAAAYGLFSITTPQLGQVDPIDPRQVNQDTRPEYNAEESVFLLNAKHDFENWTFKLNAGLGNSKIFTKTDFDGGVGPVLTRPPVICAPVALGGLPAICNLTGGPLGPVTFPLSGFDVGITGPDGLTGYIGGNVQSRSNRYQAVDLSAGETDYWSVEGIATTDFDGPLNFLLGASYSKSNGYADYAVATTGLDYFSAIIGTLSAVGAGIPNAASIGFGAYTPFFWNDTDDAFTKSLSFFGETYWDITDSLKFIGGFRYNLDEKGVRDRGNLLESLGAANPLLAIVPFGTQTVRPLLDPDELTQGTPGAVNDFRVVEADFNAPTGRAVLQWTPTDNAQLYFSYTRGYKAGGFNPRTNFAAVPLTFDPENINAFEVGAKMSLLDGRLRANLTGFYYDYSGLQVSRIFANTSINENINATIYGAEGEFVWLPTDRLTFNMNASYLNTDIGDFATVDVRNPTAGAANAELIADLTNGSNCVVSRTGGAPLIGQVFGGPFAGLNPLIASPFSVCAQLAANIGTINLATGGLNNYALIDGIQQSVAGNQLPGSSEFKVAGGVQYEFPVGASYALTPRVDAFWQSEQFTNIFNTEQDRIDGYAYVNAQVRFGPTEGNWDIRFFMQNVTNNDAIAGIFDVGQGAGNFQNLFLLEPRRWGFGVNFRF